MRTVALSELTVAVSTWNPSRRPDEEFEYVDLSAVDNESKRIVAPTMVIGADAPSRARQLVAAGDVLVSTVRPNLNAVAVVPDQLDGATASTGFSVLRPGLKLDGRYLFHWVRSPGFVAEMVRKATGASYPAVSDRIVKESAIPAPPLDEQRRMAAILDLTDVLRAKRRQVLAHLDSVTQSVFYDTFGGESFPRVKAGELMPNLRNGLSPASAGECPADVLTLSAVTQGTFDPTAVKPGLFATDPPRDKRVTAADFMMCRGNGNRALVGVGAYSAVDRPDLVFPDTVIAGRIDTSKVTMPFLNAAWKQRLVRTQIEYVARTTNGTYKVNQRTLSGVTVPLPPLDLQHEFGSRAGYIEVQRDAVLSALATEEELFASLQSRAFHGEL